MATIIKRVTQASELAGIHGLQSANLARHLAPAERVREGFLTSEYTPEFLAQLHQHAPAVIAVDGDTVVGYALVATPATRALGPALAGLFESIDMAVAGGLLLPTRNYLVCAAICVAGSHRGTGLLARLYARMRADFAPPYDCLLTDIARANTRSLQAHRRAGFEVRGSVHYEGQTWDLVMCDWAGTPAP